jgi:pimeloyl-ACP methyl ester carboxylesterase
MILGDIRSAVTAHSRVGNRFRAAAVMAMIASGLLGPAAGQAAANANFLGSWQPNTGGGWTITSQTPSGSCTGTTVFESSGYTFSNCQVSGNEYKFDVDDPAIAYESHNHGTIEGNKVTGEFNDTNGTNTPYTAVRTGGGTSVGGQVTNVQAKAAEGITITVTGTSDTEKPVASTVKTDASGQYSVEVEPGNYTVTASGDASEQIGGTLAVKTVSGVPDCTGTAKETSCALKHIAVGETGVTNFTYTLCGASERTIKGKEPTSCPIIFIPGILGSRIVCNTGELFISLKNFGAYFKEMQLQKDGETPAAGPGCSASAHVPPGEEGLLLSVAGVDAYGEAWNYIKGIAPNGAYVYPYDWRRGVPVAAEGLTKVVNEVLEKTGAKHVVLVAHSMGGLVTQQYVLDSGGSKVSRALTIGTPYWGAPKSMISLMNGLTNEFSGENLDKLVNGEDLQNAVRNYTGLFWLYPSTAYGPWLQILGTGYPKTEMGGSQIDRWIASLGATPALLDRAEQGHSTLDGFKPGEVDYQIIVGTGLPTITSMTILVNEFEPEQWISASYASGDATVPARSQTQGAFPSGSAPVKIHYICGVAHASEPASAQVTGKIKNFLLSGGEIGGPEEACRYGGNEIVTYHTKIAGHGSASASVVTAKGSTMPVKTAAEKGLIQFLELGGRTIIITNEREPVTLSMSGHEMAVRVRTINNNSGGPATYYGPVNGAITISGSVVSKGGKKLRAKKPGHGPKALAHVKRHGKHFLVTLRASDSSGIRLISYRIGNAKAKTYSRPLLLDRKQLKQLRFDAVDVFGVWGRSQRAHAPG